MSPTIFASSWRDGVLVITGDTVRHELPQQPVRALCAGPRGVLAIVDGTQLRRRGPDGEWQTLAGSDLPLACILVTADAVLVGTDDAQVLRLDPDGTLQPLTGFARTAGRERWYAGTAVIDGRVIGPPLGVRSIAATCTGSAIFANVHVGGIPRSTDGGASWQPTVAIDWDVHQVCPHPLRANVVAAAAGTGVCLSLDGGVTWTTNAQGLHAPYCAAVAFCGDDLLVSAAQDHFATSGAVYRLPLTDPAAVEPVMFGASRWLGAIVDSHCLASQANAIALVDRTGLLFWSQDGGRHWDAHAQRLPMTSALLVNPFS